MTTTTTSTTTTAKPVTAHGRSVETTRSVSTTVPAAPASTTIHFNAVEWIAAGAFVGLAVLCTAILFPWRWPALHESAYVVVGRVDGGEAVDSLQRNLAIYGEDAYRSNQKTLYRLYWCFSIGCVLLGVQVVFWILDLAMR